MAVGCTFLGWSSRSHRNLANASGSLLKANPMEGGLNQAVAPAATGGAVAGPAHSILTGLPLIFEPNQGQGNLDPTDSRAKFVAHGSRYSLFLGQQGAILGLASRANANHGSAADSDLRLEYLEMKLAGANQSANLSGTDTLPGKSNYFIGNDPAKWRRGIAQFARVRYEDVYPGINLVFYGNQGRLEYDFRVAPGADPTQAELEFNGAKQLALKDGALVIRGDGDSVTLEAPRVYQLIAGKQQSVDGKFVLRGKNRAGFVIGEYDRSRELIIDPILNFSTYFGGSGDEHATSVTVDGSFNIYLAGSTTSLNLPTTPGVVQPAIHGAQNVYIAKITPPLGSIAAALDDVTYLGGSGTDSPVGIKVDGQGDPFVAGTTSSPDFPTTPTNAYQSVPEAGSAGTSHVFVSKLKFDFTQLNYSSYLSGNGTDVASGMAIDPAGDLYVTGTTTSSDSATTTVQFPASTLPEALPYQSFPRAPIQFFVTKVNTNAPGTASVSYSTYFGGGTFETASPIAVGGGIAVDTNQNVYFTGTTNFTYSGCSGCGTTDFPILNAYQACLDEPPTAVIVNPPSCSTTASATESDAFVAKLNLNAPQGQQLVWSTYLGGTQTDSSTGVALDSGAANVYVVGTTNSQTFVQLSTSTFAAYQKCLNNLPQTTASTTACTAQTDPAPSDAFVARLTNPTATTGTPVNIALNYFSYLGGQNDEAGAAITVDSNSGAMITGWTQSPFTNVDGTFPVLPNPSSIQTNLNGPQDAFVARLNTGAVVGQTTVASWATFFGGSGTDAGTGIALDVNQNTYLAGETNSTDLQVAKPLTQGTSNSGGFDSFVTQLGTAMSLSIQGALSLGTGQTYISAGNPATFTYTITNNGPDPANNIVITDNLSSSVTGVPLTNISGSVSTGSCSGGGTTSTSLSCGPINLQSGSTATVTITATPTADTNGASPEFFNGGTVQAIAPGNIVLAQTSVPAQMSDYDMSISPANLAVPEAGKTATYTVVLTPQPIYQSAISLSCSGLPSATACAFSSTSVTLTSGPSTSTLNVVTTARPITPAASMFVRRYYAFWLVVPGIALLGMGRDRRRRRIAGILMLCAVFSMLLLVPACSSSKTQTPVSGTPAGNYTITVTAASGSDSKTRTIGLSVP